MTTITLPRAVVEQVLEALNSLAAAQLADGTYADKDCKVTLAITALRAALAQQAVGETAYDQAADMAVLHGTKVREA